MLNMIFSRLKLEQDQIDWNNFSRCDFARSAQCKFSVKPVSPVCY